MLFCGWHIYHNSLLLKYCRHQYRCCLVSLCFKHHSSVSLCFRCNSTFSSVILNVSDMTAVHHCVFQTCNCASVRVSDITAVCHHVFKTSQLCVTVCFRHHNCVSLCFRHHNCVSLCVLDVTIVYHCVF